MPQDWFSKYSRGGDWFSKYSEPVIESPSLPSIFDRKKTEIPTPKSTSTFRNFWNAANEPLTNAPSRFMSQVRPGMARINPGMANRFLPENPGMPGASEVLGDFVSQSTSPFSIATMAAGPLSRVAPLAGKVIGRGSGAIQGLAGAKDISEGNYGAGAANIGFGALGIAQKYGPRVQPAPEPIPEFPLPVFRKNVQTIEEPAQNIGANRIAFRGSTQMPPQSTGVPDVVVPNRLKPVTENEAAFNALIPERYKPQTEVWPTGPTNIPANAGPSGITIPAPPKRTIEIISEMKPKFKTEGRSVPDILESNLTEVSKKVSPLQWKERIGDWFNTRNSADYAGLNLKKQFTALDKEGMGAILKIQDGENYAGVRKYFNDRFKDVQKVFPNVKYRENYLPQIWNNTDEEIKMVYGSKLTTRPSFTMERVLEDYTKGIEAGLKPKFSTVSDLVGWYEQKVTRAIADREFFDYLINSRLLKPTAKAPQDWKSINADAFPIILDKNKRGMTYSAPTEIAKAIENILLPDETMFGKAASASSFMKNMMLTGGIPRSGVNWHTAVSIPTRALIGDGLKAMAKNYYYDVNPGAARSYIDDHLPEAVDAVKHGMGMGAEGFWKTVVPEDRNIAQKFEGLFSDVAFKEILPALKLETWDKTWKSFAAKGMDVVKAKKEAAKFTNNLYGGIQSPLMRKETQNFLRLGLLAPDWARTKFNLGVEAVKALKNPSDPVGRKYLTTVAKMSALFGAQAALGLSIRGKDAPSASRLTNIPVGRFDNKDVEFVPSGTALDTIGIPAKVGYDIAKGDTPTRTLENLKYQLSPWMQAVINQTKGEDDLGNPLTSKDRFGRDVEKLEMLTNIISNILSHSMPMPIQAATKFGMSQVGDKKMSPVQAISEGVELPFRFYNKNRK